MTVNINTKYNTKKGYFTLETAVFLPVFILGVLAIGVLILFQGTEEKAGQIVLDELEKTSAKAYILPVAPGFSSRVEKRMRQELDGVDSVQIERFRYLYANGTEKGLIYLSVVVRNSTHLPKPFQKTAESRKTLKCRGLIGRENKNSIVPFDEMEQYAESTRVWVFPSAGKRYHKENCTYVKANAKQYVLQKQIKRKYRPCASCKSEYLPIGSLVFCFTGSGESYHKGTCKTVNRYVKEMEKEEAQKRGYTPCSKCGGE